MNLRTAVPFPIYIVDMSAKAVLLPQRTIVTSATRAPRTLIIEEGTNPIQWASLKRAYSTREHGATGDLSSDPLNEHGKSQTFSTAKHRQCRPNWALQTTKKEGGGNRQIKASL